METPEEVLPAENSAEPCCASCGSILSFTPSKTPLCDSCRTAFINYPIPTWIKYFGGAILVILIYSLYFITRDLKTGIHYERGMKAAKARKYMTAEREFRNVVAKEPNYKEAQCHLLIAAYYNDDLNTVRTAFSTIKDESVDDQALFNEVSTILENASNMMPSDSFAIVMDKYYGAEIPEAEYSSYLGKNRNDVYAALNYAGFLNDHNRYNESDSLLSGILTDQPENYGVISLKIPVKRELGQLDSAKYYVGQLLIMNRENVFALASMARILLKEKKDDEALALAKKCVRINNENAYALCTLALAYHFRNDFINRDAVITQAAGDSTNAGVVGYVRDVISGKEKFRD
jgi:Tfp pilus assembly protein PilF